MENPERELLATARKVANLMTKRRKLKKQLKDVNTELRHERKMLKAMAAARTPQTIPSRLFGDGVGYVVPPPAPDFNAPVSAEVEAFVEGINEGKKEKVR